MSYWNPSAAVLFVVFCFSISSGVCEKPKPVDFATDIYPVLKANCLSCHNSTKAKADLILESPQDMIKGGESGPAVFPEDAEGSLLYTTAAHIEEPVMPPPNNKAKARDLNDGELDLLKRWINEGARGEKVANPAPESWSLLTGPQPVYTSALTPDGRFAAVGRGQRVDVYDLRLGKFAASLVDPDLEYPTAHRDIVQSLAFNSDGTLASGGFRIARIWQRSKAIGGTAMELAHDGVTFQVSPNRKIIAIYDIANPSKPQQVLKNHKGEITALSFSPDNRFLYSADATKNLVRASLTDPKAVAKVVLPTVATGIACVDGGKHILAACNDRNIRLFRADLSAFSETGPSYDFSFEAVAISSLSAIDGKNEFLVGYQNGNVLHLKLNPADLKAKPVEVRKIAHGSAIKDLAVSKDRIATMGATGSIKLWNVADGKLVAEASGSDTIKNEIAALNRKVTVANRLKTYWSAKIKAEENLWKAESEKAKSSGTEAAKASREKEKKRIALTAVRRQTPAAKPEQLSKAEAEYKTAVQTYTTQNRNRESATRLAGAAFARQVEASASVAEADALVVALKAELEALTKKEAEESKQFSAVSCSFSPDGAMLAASLKSGEIRLWSAGSGAWIEDCASASGEVEFAGDHRVFVLSDKRKIAQQTLAGESWTLTKTLGDGKDATVFSDRVSALAFHPHGHQLIAGSGVPSRSGELSVWDTTSWERLHINRNAHDDSITSLAFSPEGDQLVSGGTDRLVRTFSTETLEETQTFEGHSSHVLDVDWNADGLTLASASADLQAKIWNIADGKQKSKVEGFQKDVTSVAFIGETESLLTASGDKSLKQSNQPLPGAGKTFLHTAEISGDGNIIIAAGEDSFLRVWDRTAKKLLHEFPIPEYDSH
ncbi:MAG: hypothetical protein P1V20_01520 [Verrucomicrobiales bacterium]|nr:hypothetical protein [Verrucomicrobiales bacterium]